MQLLSTGDLHLTHLGVLWNCSPRQRGCLCASAKVSDPGVSYELRSLLMRLSNWYIVLEKRAWLPASSWRLAPRLPITAVFIISPIGKTSPQPWTLICRPPVGYCIWTILIFKKEIYSSRKLCFSSRHFRGPALKQLVFLLKLENASSHSLGRAWCVRDSSKWVKRSSCPRELPLMLWWTATFLLLRQRLKMIKWEHRRDHWKL